MGGQRRRYQLSIDRHAFGFHGEKGASAIVIAFSMILMLGFAALAVDVGAGFNERRRDQNTADTAVLGGALEIGLSTDPFEDAIVEIKDLVNANLGQTVPDADWIACVDSGALAYNTRDDWASLSLGSSFSECISFGSATGATTVRVRIPTQSIDTTFGRVLGVDSLNTSAFAEASSSLGDKGSISFPSGILSGDDAGTESCIKTGTSAGQSCGDPSTGDFGTFNPYFYFDANPTNPDNSVCDSGEQPFAIPVAMANGIDHPFGLMSGTDYLDFVNLGVTDNIRVNGDDCPGNAGPLEPNAVNSSAGYSNADISNGLVFGGGGADWEGPYRGRVDQDRYDTNGDGNTDMPAPYRNTSAVFGVDIDNRPLWTYIDKTLLDVTHSHYGNCVAAADADWNPDATNGLIDPLNPYEGSDYDLVMDYLISCLSYYRDQIFDDEIAYTPRLASVPRYHESSKLASNSCCYHVESIVPMFLQGMWAEQNGPFQCTGNLIDIGGNTCVHLPGLEGDMSVPAPGLQRISSASGIVLDCDHLSDDVCSAVTGIPSPGGNFRDIELTR